MSHKTRILSALWMIPLAVLTICYLPTPWMGALFAAVLLAGLYEWTTLSQLYQDSSKRFYLLGNAVLLCLIAWTNDADQGRLLHAIAVGGVFWCVCLAWLWKMDFARENTPRNRNLKLLAGSLACVPAWAALVWIHGSSGGPGWTLLAIGLIAAADSGAYLFGVNFGKRKLAPRISPGKSWEGFWGGLLTTVAIALLAMPAFDAPMSDAWRYAVLGIGVALFSVVGDLFESLLKRHAQIKDSSSLIPGHGGLLDRLDSIMSGLVVFALIKYWLAI
jgi:phosphatidate cytidylyltransferase